MVLAFHAFPSLTDLVADSCFSGMKVPLKDGTPKLRWIEPILAQMCLLTSTWDIKDEGLIRDIKE